MRRIVAIAFREYWACKPQKKSDFWLLSLTLFLPSLRLKEANVGFTGVMDSHPIRPSHFFRDGFLFWFD